MKNNYNQFYDFIISIEHPEIFETITIDKRNGIISQNQKTTIKQVNVETPFLKGYKILFTGFRDENLEKNILCLTRPFLI